MSSRPGGWASRGGGVRPYWEARFPGDCEACEHPIKIGQEIMRADVSGYVHMECPTPPPADKFVGTDDESMGF